MGSSARHVIVVAEAVRNTVDGGGSTLPSTSATSGGSTSIRVRASGRRERKLPANELRDSARASALGTFIASLGAVAAAFSSGAHTPPKHSVSRRRPAMRRRSAASNIGSGPEAE